jgi:FAD binding domain
MQPIHGTATKIETAPAGLRDLAAAIAGSVVTPADAEWDSARLAWALSVDQRPVAVALPETAEDIVAIVDFARENGLRVAPQGTGHNAHLLEDGLSHSILVKTERMRGVEVDAENHRARVQAGALWGDVVEPASEHGLAALAGSSPDVGVVGYSLGGGLSFLSRRHGLAANSVHAVELVTADGRLVRADRHNDPDLFWAVRGGGGSFGVVTAIEIELLPITQVYAGAMFFAKERAREVLQAWREWTQQELPDAISSVGRVINFPPFPEVPEPLRGRSFTVIEAIYVGEEAEGAELVAPLRELGPEIDTMGTVPAAALSHLHMDPPGPVAGKGDGMLLESLPAEAVDALVDATTGDRGTALIGAELRHLGGAIARPAPGHGALTSIDAPYIMFAVGAVPTPELLALVEDQVSEVKDALAPWRAPYMYMNFAERPIEAKSLYAHEYTYRRLRTIKANYDPQDLIQSNHPIAPAR